MKTREQRITIPAGDVEIQAVVVEPVGTPARTRRPLLHRHLPAHRVDAAHRAAAGGGGLPGLPARDLPARLPRGRAGVRRRGQGRRPRRGGRHDDRAVRRGPGRRPGVPRRARRPRRDRGGRLLPRRSPGLPRGVRPPRRPRPSASTPPGCTTESSAPTWPTRSTAPPRSRGRLMVIFGSADPHVPAPARLRTVEALYAAGHDGPRAARLRRWRARLHARRRRRGTTPSSPTAPWSRPSRSSADVPDVVPRVHAVLARAAGREASPPPSRAPCTVRATRESAPGRHEYLKQCPIRRRTR